MNQVAVFVDAGYFWVQAAEVACGKKAPRRQLKIDYEALRHELTSTLEEQFPNRPLLRVYWYDGPLPNGSKGSQHLAIEELDDFKLRLGTRNGKGNQKGVDGLIIADLIALAQSKAISAAVILSGDADLTPGVTAAQNLGIRVHLLSMGSKKATSPYLRAEVDCKIQWESNTVKRFVSLANVSEFPCQAGKSKDESIFIQLARQVKAEFPDTATHNGQIPRNVDGKLLWLARQHFDRALTESEKRTLRNEFKKHLTMSESQ